MLREIYVISPAGLVGSWWKLVVAVVTALSALVAVGSEGRQLSWRAIMAMVTAGAAIAVYPAVEAATITVSPLRAGGITISSSLFGVDGYLDYGKAAAGGIIVLAAVARCRPEVRRRVGILLLPIVVTIPIVPWAVGNSPVWAALALIPLLGFGAGLFWLRRYERFLSALSAK